MESKIVSIAHLRPIKRLVKWKEPGMVDAIQTKSSGRERINRVHFAVGFLVLVTGVYVSAFAVNLLMR
jgi:hypothetical protein